MDTVTEASVLKELETVLQSFADRGICIEDIDTTWVKQLGSPALVRDLKIVVSACGKAK